MIEMFKDTEMRNSGLIFNSTFNQIKSLYAMDPTAAGELAISAIELVLTGDISSDDPMISLMLEPMRIINENNNVKYDNKVENSRQKRIRELDLEKVAALMNQNYTQKQIGERLGITQQNVSYRVNVIRTKFPELLIDTNTLQTKVDFTNKNTNNLQTIQTAQTKNTNKVDDTNTLQTVQTNFTNSTNNLQTVQIDTKESVCEVDSVCQSSLKSGETRKKFSREENEKNGFNF